MLSLLQESSDILDASQFISLVQFLSDRMETHRNAMAEDREERRPSGEAAGHGPDGFHGGAPGPGGEPGAWFEELAEELGLSDEQQLLVSDALQEMREAMQALWSQYPPGEGNREVLMGEIEKIRAEFEQKLEATLEPERSECLEALRAQRHSEIEARREREQQRLERHVNFLREVLDLTDSQAQQVGAIMTDAAQQSGELHHRTQGDEISLEDMRTELDRTRDEASTAVRGLLAPEQAEAFEALKELVPGHGRPLRRPRPGD